MTAPLRVAIAGAGRMGRSIAARIAARDDLVLAGTWSRGGDLAAIAADADVIIDFSLPVATDKVLDAVAALRKPLVCGVTGLNAAQMQRLDAVAGEVPLVYDRNMSQGITVLEAVVRQVSAALDGNFSVEIEEVHHVHKQDAPSGTALKLGEAVTDAGKHGEIRYQSERTGEVPGDHRVIFRSPTEVLTLGHSVSTRDVFADGALRAARWVQGRPPGRYSMRDVVLGQ